MRRPKFSLFFFLLAPALSINLFAQTPQKEGPATIAGVVTLNGEPARGVSVALQMQNPSMPFRPSPPNAKTDANGRFRITGIAAGQYIVGAMAPGFVTGGNQSNAQSYGLQGKTITVSEGEIVEGLELPLKRGCVVTGRVTDSNGEPIVETYVRLARVVATDVNGPSPPPINNNAYRTDDRGIYRIFGLPAGKYKVSVGIPMREGYFGTLNSRTFIPETFHPDTTDESQAKIVELENGQEATDVDIKTGDAKRAYEISGRVVDATNGKPLAGLGLAYGTYGKEGRMISGGAGNWFSDVNGEFHIIGVRPGKHGVFIENRDGKSELTGAPTPVEVIDGDVAGVEVQVQPGASISGTIVIEGTTDPAILAKRAQIRLVAFPNPPNSPGSFPTARVNADGSFHFGGMSAGKFRFSSSSGQVGITLLRVERNGTALTDSSIEMRSGEQVTGVRVVFGYGNAIVRGQVKIIGGALPEEIKLTVSLSQAGIPLNSSAAPLDDRGQFFMRNLIPGKYELRIGYRLTFNQPGSREILNKFLPAISKAKQTVTATNGADEQVTLTIDLSQENN